MIDHVRYRPIVGGRITVCLVFAFLLSVVVLAGIAAISTGGSGGLLFLAICAAAFAWNVRSAAFQMAFELRLTDTHLDAIGLVRRWHVPLEELRCIQPSGPLGGAIAIESTSARPIVAFAARGLRDFIDGLITRRPDLPVDIDAISSLLDKVPGWSRTERD